MWMLFVRINTTSSCCEYFRYIFINSHSAFNAIDQISKEIFTCDNKSHEFKYDEYLEGNSKQDVWEQSNLAKKYCDNVSNVNAILDCSDVIVINAGRIIMPDGTDGLICEGDCKEFWPYVQKRPDNDKFICMKCR